MPESPRRRPRQRQKPNYSESIKIGKQRKECWTLSSRISSTAYTSDCMTTEYRAVLGINLVFIDVKDGNEENLGTSFVNPTSAQSIVDFVVTHPYWKQEGSIGDVRKGCKRPLTTLGECLIGYPHFLRWPEEMGLVEYPHFFRYIHHVFMADRARDALIVTNVSLDEVKVKRLTLQVTSRVEGATLSFGN